MSYSSLTLYWFNGSSYYTLFFSFSLSFAAFLIRMFFADDQKKIILCVINSFAAVVLGGGNFSTSLVCVELLVITLFLLTIKKAKNKRYFGIVLLFLGVAFLINITAPGNTIRARESEQLSPVIAILESVFYAIVYVGKWTELPQIIYLIFISPILYIASRNCKWTFKYPVLVEILAFLLFASQLTPSLYALGNLGAGRLINLYYYSYYLLMTFGLFYLFGWINKKYGDIVNIEKVKTICEKYWRVLTIVLVALFGAGCFNYGIHNMTSISTMYACILGTPQQYEREYEEAIAILESGCFECEIEELETVPEFFNGFNLSDDEKFWVNRQMAEYFDVDSVKRKEK